MLKEKGLLFRALTKVQTAAHYLQTIY